MSEKVHINNIVTDFTNSEKEGFIFTSITNPTNILDAIVIRNPETCDCSVPKKNKSKRLLNEHIELIKRYKIKKAFIIAENIDFIKECPTLEYVEIIPADTAKNKFDYSPLYEMPNLKYLSCKTKYGGLIEDKNTSIDYSKIIGLRELTILGEGHNNYNKNDKLESLYISYDKEHMNMNKISNSSILKRMSFTKCNINSMQGIKKFNNIQELSLQYMPYLYDITELQYVSKSLRALNINNCHKIEDFSCLHSLYNLEHLELCGKNNLSNLDFLLNMKKLKTFVFSMNVSDNDLTKCMAIPYVYCMKNKRQYNLKNKDLPKCLPIEPFVCK